MLIHLLEEMKLMFSVFLIVDKDPPLEEHIYKRSKMADTSESVTQKISFYITSGNDTKLQF